MKMNVVPLGSKKRRATIFIFFINWVTCLPGAWQHLSTIYCHHGPQLSHEEDRTWKCIT
jgi:hypothetical protein